MKQFYCDDIWKNFWYEVPKKGSWEIFREEQRKIIASNSVGENVLQEKQEQELGNDIGEKEKDHKKNIGDDRKGGRRS
jgi:hypothetical protein